MRDKEKARLWHKAYYQLNKEKMQERSRLWHENNKEQSQSNSKAYRKAKYHRLRKQILDALGSWCSCCGESQYEFLTIDHINTDGAAERKDIGTGIELFKYIIAQGIPKTRYQILCQNCNTAKYYHKGRPHQKAICVEL